MYRSATAEGREHYADQSGAATGGMNGAVTIRREGGRAEDRSSWAGVENVYHSPRPVFSDSYFGLSKGS